MTVAVLSFLGGAFTSAMIYHFMIIEQCNKIEYENKRHAVSIEHVIAHVNGLEKLLKSHDIKMDFKIIRIPLEIVEAYLSEGVTR